MVAFPILVLNLVYQGYSLATSVAVGPAVNFLVAVALVLMFFCARMFALRVQDRVIRLEMRLRMREVLPPDLQARIGEFTLRQLVALRFASDEELPGLARKVLDGRITDGRTIKQMVQHWQADTLRA
jgi:hypothetical protein